MGVIEDVLVEDKEVPIFLGRPFLAMGNTLIDSNKAN